VVSGRRGMTGVDIREYYSTGYHPSVGIEYSRYAITH
jgi:hypothetical protein